MLSTQVGRLATISRKDHAKGFGLAAVPGQFWRRPRELMFLDGILRRARDPHIGNDSAREIGKCLLGFQRSKPIRDQ
jgi:hypothetical protein